MARTWSDRGGGGIALPVLTPVVKRVILATCGVFLLQFAVSLVDRSSSFLERWFGVFPLYWESLYFPVWQVGTYGFLHSTHEFGHILWNMLWVYFLGTMLEGIVGGRRFLSTYLGAMVAGGVLQLLASLVLPGNGGFVIGASGAALGVTLAMATLRPQTVVILLFIPVTLRTLAIIHVGKDVFELLLAFRDGGNDGVAHFAHLGGAAFGFAAARFGWVWRDPFAEVGRVLERRRAQSKVRDAERLDQLLAKINREGIQSLSAGERAFLKRASKRS